MVGLLYKHKLNSKIKSRYRACKGGPVRVSVFNSLKCSAILETAIIPVLCSDKHINRKVI